MKKIIFSFLGILLVCAPLFVRSQSEKPLWNCGSDALNMHRNISPELLDKINNLVKQKSSQGGGKYSTNGTNTSPMYMIPVVFHVIYDPTSADPYPSYNQILWQLASLNAAFANDLTGLNNVPSGPHAVNTQIQFCLAKNMQVSGSPAPWPNGTPGMVMHPTTNYSQTHIDAAVWSSLSNLGNFTNYLSDFPPDMYLNIFCVPHLQDGFMLLAGVGAFPWLYPNGLYPIDGIVMWSYVVGNNYYGLFTGNINPLQWTGNIMAHEAGHYLGLFHTFEKFNTPNLNDIAGVLGCYGMTNPTGGGDLIYDTPPTSISWQPPTPPVNTCNETYAPYTLAPDENDQIENFMSYSDDVNLNTFTRDQTTRMWAALDGTYFGYFQNAYRYNLWQPANLTATGVYSSPSCGPGILTSTFIATPNLALSTCSTVPYTFHTPTFPANMSATSFAWNFGDGNTSNLQNPTHTYTILPTDYTVTLTVSDGTATSTTTLALDVPETFPRIVGQSGDGIEVCQGSEQTILIKFPITCTAAVLTDGTTTYTVLNNRPHWCTGPGGVYTMPFTFPVNASGLWYLVPQSCGVFGTGTAKFTVRVCCPNLIKNGDVEQGFTAFYSDYTINPSVVFPNSPGYACAGVLPVAGASTGQMYFNSDMYTTFPGPVCQNPGSKKILAGQVFNGLIAGQSYYVSFKVNESGDSVSTCGPSKFNLKLTDGVGYVALDVNEVPCTYPNLNCSNPKFPDGFQVFNYQITVPGGITPGTPLTLELSEVDNSAPDFFDHIIDNIQVRRILPLVAPPPPVLSVTSPTPLCYPAAFTVCASGAATVTWQPGGSIGTCIQVSPPPGAPVTFTTSYNNGYCLFTDTISVVQQPSLSLVTAPSVTLCTNLPVVTTTAALSATLNPNVPHAIYVWEPGGLSGQDQVVSPGSTTVYTVTATTPNGCTIQATQTVVVSGNCCPSTFTASILSGTIGNTVVNGPMVILEDLTIDAGFYASTKLIGEFAIAAGVKINITPGDELFLNGAHLYACGTNMWQGMVVENGALLSSNNNSLIEDAVIAVDANYIDQNHHGYVVEASNTTFNKNYISIRFANATNIHQLQTFIVGCVFTCRDLQFTQTTWPSAGTISPGLRFAGSVTNPLSSPYGLQGYMPVNLKLPLSNQPSQVGIEVINFDNVGGSGPWPGVIIGQTNTGNSSFNLFDNIGTGIDVTNSSLTAYNNVFQNMRRFNTFFGTVGGTGIRQTITSTMNAGLYLSPPGGFPSYVNRFFDCYVGVDATNAYDIDATYLTMRSMQSSSSASPGFFLKGNTGIQYTSNRFTGVIRSCDFSNIRDAIKMNVVTGNYDMGSGLLNGVFCNNFNISQNYFGIQVNSSTAPLANEYMYTAVTLNGVNSGVWSGAGGVSISSNKIYKAYSGISVTGMRGYPVDVHNNNITLLNDVLSQAQYGIRFVSTRGSVNSFANTITGPAPSNAPVAGYYCTDNSGTSSPKILCNSVQNCYTGFHFYGANGTTVWRGNSMNNHYYALLLNNAGVIGTQGTTSSPIDNTWGTATWHTYCIGSSPTSSKLHVKSTAPYYPTVHGSSGGAAYSAPTSIVTATGNYVCPVISLPPPPNYKTAEPGTEGEETGLTELVNAWGIQVYPNPASDHITIRSEQEKETIQVRCSDVSGKVVFEKQLSLNGNSVEVALDLEQGLYLLEIVNERNQRSTSKLVIAK